MIRLRVVAVVVCSLALVSACGGDSTPDAASPSAPAATSATSVAPPTTSAPAPATSSAASPGEAFCTGFEKNGGTLASIGEPPAFYAKEELVRYAEETLAVMKGLRPPAEITAAWTTYQQFQTRLLAAARSLGAGRRLSGPVAGYAEVEPAYTKINAYITANC